MLLAQEKKQTSLVNSLSEPDEVQLDMRFGQRIKEARQIRGLTQADLSRASGVSQTGISALELGRGKTATGENLFALADALRVNPRWLISGEGPMDDDTSDRQKLIDMLSGVPLEKLQALVSLISKS